MKVSGFHTEKHCWKERSLFPLKIDFSRNLTELWSRPLLPLSCSWVFCLWKNEYLSDILSIDVYFECLIICVLVEKDTFLVISQQFDISGIYIIKKNYFSHQMRPVIRSPIVYYKYMFYLNLIHIFSKKIVIVGFKVRFSDSTRISVTDILCWSIALQWNWINYGSSIF